MKTKIHIAIGPFEFVEYESDKEMGGLAVKDLVDSIHENFQSKRTGGVYATAPFVSVNTTNDSPTEPQLKYAKSLNIVIGLNETKASLRQKIEQKKNGGSSSRMGNYK